MYYLDHVSGDHPKESFLEGIELFLYMLVEKIVGVESAIFLLVLVSHWDLTPVWLQLVEGNLSERLRGYLE